MDLEKAYDRVDREALWNVLKIYGEGGQLVKGILYRLYIERQMHEWGCKGSSVRVLQWRWEWGRGVWCHHGCLMSLWMGVWGKWNESGKHRWKVEVKWKSLVCCNMPLCRWHCSVQLCVRSITFIMALPDIFFGLGLIHFISLFSLSGSYWTVFTGWVFFLFSLPESFSTVFTS